MKIDANQTETKILANTFEKLINNLKDSKISNPNHHYSRSVKWYFSLPNRPKIFFNRWQLFDEMIGVSDKSRPFYEFGVWNGISFKYLIKLHSDFLKDMNESIQFNTMTSDLLAVYFYRLQSNVVKYAK